jgi:two-component system, NarL family, response regulator LiaR
MLTVVTPPLEGSLKVLESIGTTRVVLADDHDVVRQGLKRLLDRAPEIEVVGEASDGLEALNSVKALAPDVLLLDIEMPVMDGIEVARRLREANIDVRILILSAYDDREYIRALLDIGVSGYLVKGEAPGKIVEAVRGIAKGQRGWVSPQVRKKLEKMQNLAYHQNTLTYRDLQLLRLLAGQKSQNEIAQSMRIRREEVSQLIADLVEKMGVNGTKDAVEVAVREGWVSGA